MINKNFFALPVIEQLSPAFSRRKLDDLELIVVDHPQVKLPSPYRGAHLLSRQPAGEEEVLWLSNNTPFKKRRRPARRRTHLLAMVRSVSATGAAVARFRTQPAMVAKNVRDEDENGVMLTFELQSSDETRKYWPHDFTLYARFKLGKTCEIELEAHGEFETTSAPAHLFQRWRYRGGES